MSSYKQANLLYYNAEAGKYDGLYDRHGRNHRVRFEKLFCMLRPNQGESVLELAPGTGVHAHALLSRIPIKYTGIDLSEGMLKELRANLAKFPDATFVEGDAEAMPFGNDVFDRAYCSGGIHHLTNPDRGISECLRVLRPGGRFAFVEPNVNFPRNRWESIFVPSEKNIRLMKLAGLREWVRAAGGIVEESGYFIYTPNGPRFLAPLLERIDSWLGKLPLLSRFSINLFIGGRKP